MRKNNWKFILTCGCTLAFTLLLVVAVTQPAHGQTYSVIHNFTGGQDGAAPLAGLTIDRGGNLYGTTDAGGAGYGTVFKLAHRGSNFVLNPLYSFAGGTDGAGTRSRVIFGRDGTLYGATTSGGYSGSGCSFHYPGCGTVFHMKPPPNAICGTAPCPWTETVLYRFSGGSDGAYPQGDIVFDQAGTIYGATYLGGEDHDGAIYSLTPSGGGWNQSVIYSFTGGNDGAAPHGFETFDSAGNLYGTAFGGAYSAGVVFQLTPSTGGWTQSVLYSFTGGMDGDAPVAGVILDSSGNLYGSTIQSGSGGGGTVFELTPSSGNWTFNLAYSFTGGLNGGPEANLVMDQAGNLYGTTETDGRYQYGSVFKLTRSGDSWTQTVLHDFTGGNDGATPWSNVVFDANGNLYGTTSAGGTGSACNGGCGVVFEITP